MLSIIDTPILNKELLINRIKKNFLNFDDFKFSRNILEFTDNKGDFLGDNFSETSFKIIKNNAPIIFQVTGPYDVISNDYAMLAQVFHKAKLIFEFDMKKGIIQRTAAMVLLYFQELDHTPNNIIFYGVGKVNIEIIEYIKYFYPSIKTIYYYHYQEKKVEFEEKTKKIGIESKYIRIPDLSKYDTVILAKNKGDYIVDEKLINSVKNGTVIISLSTTGIADIKPIVYSYKRLNLFFDYENSLTFFSDLKEAREKGYIKNYLVLKDILKYRSRMLTLKNKINLIRLTGTPLQNVAVIEMMMEMNNIRI